MEEFIFSPQVFKAMELAWIGKWYVEGEVAVDQSISFSISPTTPPPPPPKKCYCLFNGLKEEIDNKF